ncbi:MAG: hypothetical protein ACXACI_02815 [Candidatus Hodarchaeales archaeon]
MKARIAIAIFVLFTLPVTNVAANSEIEYFYTSGQAKITTPDLIVKVTSGGNIPQYFFWANGEDVSTETLTETPTEIPTETAEMNFQDSLLNLNQETRETEETEEIENGNSNGGGKAKPHLVKFLELFEFEDQNNNGVFDQGDRRNAESKITFPASTWSFSDFAVDESENSVSAVHFNFTHDGSPAIDLRNHVYARASNTLKFDIAIDEYTWHSEGSDAMLAIKILFSGRGAIQSQERNRYAIGDGFFSFEESAQGAGGSVNVSGIMEGNNAIYLCYEHFGSFLFHDPEVGVSESTEDNGVELLVVMSGMLIAAIFLVQRRRQRLSQKS